MKLIALKKKVVCKKFEKQKATTGGIIVPDTVRDDVAMVEVLSCGKDATDELKPGMICAVSDYQGSQHTVDGVEYVVYEDDQILGIVTENG